MLLRWHRRDNWKCEFLLDSVSMVVLCYLRRATTSERGIQSVDISDLADRDDPAVNR